MSALAAYALGVALPMVLLRRKFGLRFIGLTGGIASGKSATSSYLSSPPHSFPLIDFDLIAREVVTPGHRTGALDKIVRVFGEGVLKEPAADSTSDAPRTLDRTKLGALIFSNPAARSKLNSLMRVPIWSTFLLHSCDLFFRRGARTILIDVPLLFEVGLNRICDESIVVRVSPEVQSARLQARDTIAAQEAQAKINAQWSLDKKAALADVVIDNDGSLAQLQAKLDGWAEAERRREARKAQWTSWRGWVPTVPAILAGLILAPLSVAITAWIRSAL